jgi:hypothetical protein
LVYPFAAITIGFAGIVKVLVADEITDQASLGLLVFLIEPSKWFRVPDRNHFRPFQ